MTDWKALANARLEDTPAPDAERVVEVLKELDAVFHPLTAAIPLETEPATVFRAAGEDR